MSSSIHIWFHLNHSHRSYCEVILAAVEYPEIHASPLAILKRSVIYGKGNGLPFFVILVSYAV